MDHVDIRLHKEIDARCRDCFEKTYQKLLARMHATPESAADFLSFVKRTLSETDHLTYPEIQT